MPVRFPCLFPLFNALPPSCSPPFSAGLTVVQSSCEVYCQSGTCILDDECASAGKTSTPNFCPNDPLWRTPNPEIPASNVQRHVLEAGETSLAAKEGAVHVVGCYADKNRGEWQGICVRSQSGVYSIYIQCAVHGNVHVPDISTPHHHHFDSAFVSIMFAINLPIPYHD
ncbi:hypothetical protein I7I53_11754 [Histoplasma capsulatum var. duboisii H88]|uniref:Uncharacterized protein n=1 Tax=Ajellomyces capsulatus (strain H88) TaxID=544711 RepID=A0A8A1LYR4_AJEC8|nr:hypothetical protein I7I53_11754 [Histoplasma capsulatum var. duboisii H88]